MNNEQEEQIFQLNLICSTLVKEPQKDAFKKLDNIRRILEILPTEVVKSQTKHLLGTFYFFLKPSQSFKVKQVVKENIVSNLTLIFEKSEIENGSVYRNLNGYLLHEICDPTKDNKIKDISEEYKLLIINAIKSLHDCLTIHVVKAVYNKEYTVVLGTLVYVCLGLAQTEKLRSLRISSVRCIMSIARISNRSTSATNCEMTSLTANIFMHFFPGICRVLMNIALEDQKTGHKVICVAIECFGKIIILLMQDYNDPRKIKLKIPDYQKAAVNSKLDGSKNANRDVTWFANTDQHLCDVFKKLLKLCYHEHEKVRLELAVICKEIVQNCYSTMCKTSIKLFEVLITLSEDINETVSKSAQDGLDYLEVLKRDDSEFHKRLLDEFEDNFFNTMNNIHSVFYSVDDSRKISHLNLLCGYLKVFKKHKISTFLYNTANLRLLMVSLLTVCTIDKLNLRLYDEYTIQDFDIKHLPMNSPWKTFKYHTNLNILNSLRNLFELLAEPEIIEDIFHYLADVFEKEIDYKKEAIIILSDIVSECKDDKIRNDLSESLVLLYLERENLNLPINATKDVTLNETHENIVQICLQLEGVGKLAVNMGKDCNKLLLKVLYAIIEKAGSINPLIRLAGLRCLYDMSIACGYTSITELINKNSDYISYHVTRKLKYYETNKGVLDVYGVIMKHCSVEVLDSITNILENVSKQSLTTLVINDQIPFLRIYDIFLKCIMRWFDVTVVLTPIRSKQQKMNELRREKEVLFEDNVDFSDEGAKKSVEEMWKEDNEQNIEEMEELNFQDEKKDKSIVPIQINLTIQILKTSVNYLSFANDDIKILTLNILNNGVEIVRNYENELLPIVHKIWTMLQYCFKNSTKPLIFNLSFQLLVTLARLSKDFIRRRTLEKALPFVLKELDELSKNSYLKDRGSEYRNTQNYKLQIVLLENLDRLITDIDITTEDMLTVFHVTKAYLSHKQPLPFQKLCINFYKTMLFYDPKITNEHLSSLSNEEFVKNIEYIINKN